MAHRHFAVVLLALLAGALLPVACSPQVVDAVDTLPEAAGSGGTAGAGGSAVTGGTGGSGMPTGGGSACPDGGSEMDRDGDGVPDCADSCPIDPEKSAGRGLCGCGLPDEADGGVTCADVVALLAHRYAFNGTGMTAVDSQGQQNGTLVNVSLSGQGSVVLSGVTSEQYVGLPNRILSTPTLESVTLEAWVLWTGGPVWQRIFDFGDNDGPMEGEQGPGGISYLFLTPRTPNDPVARQTGKMRVAYKRPGIAEFEVTLDAEIAMPSLPETATHVALVIDGAQMRMSLYVDGVLQNGIAYFRNPRDSGFTSMQGSYDWSTPVPSADGGTLDPPPIDLTVVDDINNWLGRSQFVADSELQGTYEEFRIYAGALTPELIAISFRGGPNAEFLQ